MSTEPFQVELTDLPEPQPFDPRVRRAPSRGFELSRSDTVVALKNALRYVPAEHHESVVPEFLDELLHLRNQVLKEIVFPSLLRGFKGP